MSENNSMKHSTSTSHLCKVLGNDLNETTVGKFSELKKLMVQAISKAQELGRQTWEKDSKKWPRKSTVGDVENSEGLSNKIAAAKEKLSEFQDKM